MSYQHYDFDTINLIPKKCTVTSRKECDTTVRFGPRSFKIPVVPANMECIINEDIAETLATAGYFYSLHRFNMDAVAFAKRMAAKNLYISISVGVGEESRRLLETLRSLDLIPDYVTIDIAHGHAVLMESMLKWIHDAFPTKRPFLIAGNVSTAEGVTDLEAWGADAIKVGIGPGSACTTYNVTGFGSRGVQACTIMLCAAAATRALIVADGGIKETGDIAKAIVLGANMVMVGGMFSGLIDSPGATIRDAEGRRFKEFWGSASASQSGKKGRIEGMKTMVPCKDRTFLDEMAAIEEALQSAISYAGGKSISALRNVQYIMKN